MSKYATIKEGGIGRKFNTSFLKTANQSSGSSEWMPEDEAELEEKYISENGHYDPAKYAFSKVTVNIYDYTMGYIQGFDIDSMEFKIISVDPITIELIEMVLPEGFPQIDTTPFVIGDLELSTVNLETGEFFNIEFPEEFQSLLDDLKLNNVEGVIGYDYTQEEYIISMPDVDGGITTTPFGYTPIDVNGNPIAPQDIGNYDMGDGYVIGIDGLGEYGIATQDSLGNINITNLNLQLNSFRFDANSMISGLDANGNAVEVTLGDDGSVAVTNLPSSIEIITQPTKTVYEDGETIDITGMVVVAKNADGTTWTSAQYPNGHIPLGELRIYPETFDKSAGRVGATSDLLDDENVKTIGSCDTISYKTVYNGTITSTYIYRVNGKLACFSQGIAFAIIGACSEEEVGYFITLFVRESINERTGEITWDYVNVYPNSNSYYHDGKRVYYIFGEYYSQYKIEENLSIDGGDSEPTSGIRFVSGHPKEKNECAWTMVFGEQVYGRKVYIMWNRPVDSEELSTDFEITTSEET